VRDELLPAHELALSRLSNEKLLTISLKKEEALQYLRKEEVTINTGMRGWALVQYANLNLGLIKMLGNRINNYYPKEWRILKSGNF
jgi:NOL1/NOP2/fmu family ribosome biogenesis protein